MNIILKAEFQQAIQKVIDDNVGESLWNCTLFIHDDLAAHMTDAAEAVFDSSLAGQSYYRENN